MDKNAVRIFTGSSVSQIQSTINEWLREEEFVIQLIDTTYNKDEKIYIITTVVKGYKDE